MNEQDRKEPEGAESDETQEQAQQASAPDQVPASPGAAEAVADADAPPSVEPAAAEPASPDPQESPVDPDAEQPVDLPEPERDTSHLKWYVVHTYSGYENKARLALEERIKRDGLEEEFGTILIPTEEVVEMSRGKRRTSKRKFFPGYMLVQMNMTETTWYMVKSTPKITGFVGNSTRPQPVPEPEIRRLTSQIAEGAERLTPKIIFEKGDAVRVVDGPFASFNGTVDDVDPEKGKLRVLVSIFGRATPVEMEFVQVEKT